MTRADLNHPDPWIEAEYLALDETDSRIELIDGRLWVSPAPRKQHQYLSQNLVSLLGPAAKAAKLSSEREPAPQVRPDAHSGHHRGGAAHQTEASEVWLVVEITPPSDATTDRILKKALHAEANIDWYLLVEPDHETYETISLQLYRLDGTKYVEHAFAANGETLTTELPLPLEISTGYLLDF